MEMWRGAQNVIIRELKAKRKLYLKREQDNDRLTMREGHQGSLSPTDSDHAVPSPHSGRRNVRAREGREKKRTALETATAKSF